MAMSFGRVSGAFRWFQPVAARSGSAADLTDARQLSTGCANVHALRTVNGMNTTRSASEYCVVDERGVRQRSHRLGIDGRQRGLQVGHAGQVHE